MSGLETFGFAVEHDPRSVELYEFIADLDYKNGDGFRFSSGGDGNNGEFLMALFDEWFASRQETDNDALLKTAVDMLEMLRIGAITGEGLGAKWCRELHDKYLRKIREALEVDE